MRYSLLIPAFAFSILFFACGPSKQTSASRDHNKPSTVTRKEGPPRSKTDLKTPEGRKFSVISIRYAERLGVRPEEISNERLYEFVDEWYGAPYKYAGKSKSGVDCSGFTSILLSSVFNKQVAAPSYALYDLCKPVKKDELQEGDLVFFKIYKGRISHVGVYLANNKFVHASTKAGVIINDLDEAYYQKYFFSGGRLK